MQRQSEGQGFEATCSVYLVDSMGELPLFLAVADVAFVGGSLVPVGGHNLLEAAALGVPVAIGPHVFNFAEITRRLLAEGGAVQVKTAQALAPLLQRWLSDAAERARIGEQALAFVERNRGALQRLQALIEAELKGQSHPETPANAAP
jgi:3-deoxy-D-manno-octulosonic-acid transferase